MPTHEVTYRLISTDRTSIRKELVELFIQEEPGTGKEELASRYNYNVEIVDDSSIIIKRPAGLNKGFDFTVNVDNFYFRGTRRRHKNPSHNDIFCALEYAKNNYPEDYEKVIVQIKHIYNCEEYDYSEIGNVTFVDGDGNERKITIILSAIKWLFIEQDITYWNWSGRRMLMSGLEEKGLL